MLEATEPFETDDARRPGTEPALALDPADDSIGRQVVEPLELEVAAEPDDRRAAPLVQPEPAQLERRNGSECGGRRRLAKSGTRYRHGEVTVL